MISNWYCDGQAGKIWANLNLWEHIILQHILMQHSISNFAILYEFMTKGSRFICDQSLADGQAVFVTCLFMGASDGKPDNHYQIWVLRLTTSYHVDRKLFLKWWTWATSPNSFYIWCARQFTGHISFFPACFGGNSEWLSGSCKFQCNMTFCQPGSSLFWDGPF